MELAPVSSILPRSRQGLDVTRGHAHTYGILNAPMCQLQNRRSPLAACLLRAQASAMKIQRLGLVSLLIVGPLQWGCRDVIDPQAGGGRVALNFVFAEAGPVSSQGTGSPLASSRVLPPLDQVHVTLDGPLDTTVVLGLTAGAFEATIDELPTGTYSVVAIGRGGGLVTYYGRNGSVLVRGGETTTAPITFNSFVSTLDPVVPRTAEFTQPISFSPVGSASGYAIEVARTPAFAQPASITTNTTTYHIPVSDVGNYYVRIRAINSDVPVGESSPSDTQTWEVVADTTSGSDAGTAFDLGARSFAAGSYTGFNIFPSSDEDWFALTLAAGDEVTASVKTTSLSPSSGLDPTLRLVSPNGNTIAMNDDDSGVESHLSGIAPTAGTYNLVVGSSGQGSVGHYQIEVTHFAPVALVSVDPAIATVMPAATVQLSARTFDALGEEVTGRAVTWSSEDMNIATVDATGIVTGVVDGITGILATSEGVSGRADITVTANVLTITPDRDTLTALGDSVLLVATGGAGAVNWSTTDANIASVDANGLVIAVGNGTATITADDGTLQGTAVIVVRQEAVAILTNQPFGALAGQALNPPPSASVVDANDNVILNQAISFTVTAGGGNLSGSQSVFIPTDQFGVASTPWTLGIPPVQTLEVMAAGLTTTISVHAYFGGLGTPFIDGFLDPGEWDDSWCVIRDIAIPEGGATPGRMCIMNDQLNLYVMIRFDRAGDPNSSVTANFDVTGDGVIGAGDVYSFVVQQNGVTTLEQDGHWYDNAFDPSCAVGTLCAGDDGIHGGTFDGFFEGGNDGVATVFELEIPLRSGDPLDISVDFGSLIDMVGVLRIFDQATGTTTSTTPAFPVAGLLRVLIF